MQPILDLHKVDTATFTYSLSATASAAPQPTRELFATVERCLYDAGRSMQHYFDSVQIRYDGIALGAYAVSRLARDPIGLYDEIMQRLIATFRMHNRSHAAALRLSTTTPFLPTEQ